MKNKLNEIPVRKKYAFDKLDPNMVCIAFKNDTHLIVKQLGNNDGAIYFIYTAEKRDTLFSRNEMYWKEQNVAFNLNGALSNIQEAISARETFWDECKKLRDSEGKDVA